MEASLINLTQPAFCLCYSLNSKHQQNSINSSRKWIFSDNNSITHRWCFSEEYQQRYLPKLIGVKENMNTVAVVQNNKMRLLTAVSHKLIKNLWWRCVMRWRKCSHSGCSGCRFNLQHSKFCHLNLHSLSSSLRNTYKSRTSWSASLSAHHFTSGLSCL